MLFQHVAQFMRQPRIPYILTAKRILRYLKHIVDLGLFFRLSTYLLTIRAYSDANWAGCLDSARSTIGFCLFLALILSP